MNETDELSQAISNTWDQIIPLLGGDRELFECQLTTLLRRLDATVDQGQAAVIRSIIDLFQKYDAAHKLLLKAISQATSHRNKGAGVQAGFVKKDRHSIVPVFYGTDRAISSDTSVSYSGRTRRSDASASPTCSIPDDHRMGEIEKPNLWKLQFREDAE